MDNQTLRETSERIDELLDELAQSAVPAVMERVEELLRDVMSMYGAGLDRALEIARDAGGDALVRQVADDEVIGSPTVPSRRRDDRSCLRGYSTPHFMQARIAVGAV